MKPRKNSREVKAVVGLLQQDQEWPTPADFAVALVEAVDEARMTGEQYFGVLQFGHSEPYYLALGPFASRKASQTAIKAYPAASEACLGVVARWYTEEAVQSHLKALDEPPLGSKDWAEVRRDAIAFKRGFRGKAVERERFLSEGGVAHV